MGKAAILLILIALAVGTGPGIAAGQAAASDLQVSIKEVEPFTYVCIPHRGPFKAINHTIDRLMEASNLQDIFPTGPLMSVFYGSPIRTKPEDREWEVGFPVSPQLLAQPPLKAKSWDYTQVAEAYHDGPFAKVGETYSAIYAWLEANGYEPDGPTMEMYVSDPESMSPDDYHTRIWVPCKKK
jgi:effector-binding domain-containing protein